MYGNLLEGGRPRPPLLEGAKADEDVRPPENSQSHCEPIRGFREKMARDELENFLWHRPSGRCFRAENSSRIPGGSPAPRKILKLDADPTKSRTLTRPR